MPRDARLGLVVGVCLVMVVAVAFYHTGGSASPPGDSASRPVTAPEEDGDREVAARDEPIPGLPEPAGRNERLHTVEEGETLVSLAIKYYGDRSRSSFLFRANRDQLLAPDRVPVGTVLRIPPLTAELAAGGSR